MVKASISDDHWSISPVERSQSPAPGSIRAPAVNRNVRSANGLDCGPASTIIRRTEIQKIHCDRKGLYVAVVVAVGMLESCALVMCLGRSIRALRYQ